MTQEMRTIEFVVDAVGQKMRLDAYVGSHTQEISRSTLSDPSTNIFLNGKEVKKSKKVSEGDRICIQYSQSFFEGIVAQPIPLKVLYEDQDLLLLDKQQGMVVHPANGNMDNTLVNALAFRYGLEFCKNFEDDEEDDDLDTLQGPLVRPGIVHRLDKDTSGVMVVARTRQSQRHLSQQFKERTTKKIYIALAKGVFRDSAGTIEKHIIRDSSDRKRYTTCSENEGRSAKTTYTVLKQYSTCALLRITLHTGRTHQIRVHLKSIGHPLVSDPIYGKDEHVGLMLHAMLLEVESPSTGKRICSRAPLPPRFGQYLKTIRHPSSVPVRSR